MPRRFRARRLLLSLGSSLLAAACSIAPATATPTPEPSRAAAPSVPLAALLPTLPATATSTPTWTPSPTATPALPSGLGPLLLKETFAESSSNWRLTSGPSGAISLFQDSLIISLREPQSWLVSLYALPVPSNFYLQAVANTSLCNAGKNEFGLVYRASPLYQYRAAFTCDGELRFERYHGSELEGASGWQSTQSLQTGAPAQNQIGLRVSGGRFSFYANNQVVYTYVDTLLTSGQIGLFASTVQSSLLTVGFREFQLWGLPGSG